MFFPRAKTSDKEIDVSTPFVIVYSIEISQEAIMQTGYTIPVEKLKKLNTDWAKSVRR